jgi:hypothetical protein
MRTKRTRSRPGSVAAVAVALALVLALAPACGGDDDDTTTDEGAGEGIGGAVSEQTTTTEGETETSVTTTLPDDGGTGTGGGEPTGLAAGPPYDPADGPSGSGCTPGEVDTLPEGWWAGLILEAEGTSLQFDLMCFFTGDAAVAAADEDGETVENDYYIRNQNPRAFAVEFADTDVPASCVDTGSATTYECTVGDILADYEPGGEVAFPVVWLHISGDGPDYLFTQYLP